MKRLRATLDYRSLTETANSQDIKAEAKARHDKSRTAFREREAKAVEKRALTSEEKELAFKDWETGMLSTFVGSPGHATWSKAA